MRLFCLEVKRIMKSRRTIILLTAALLLAVIMAYLPISFESINRPGDNGSVVELNGMEAIQFKREYRQDTYDYSTSAHSTDFSWWKASMIPIWLQHFRTIARLIHFMAYCMHCFLTS